MKLICEEMHVLQLVNWRQAAEERRIKTGQISLYTINGLIDKQPRKRSTCHIMMRNPSNNVQKLKAVNNKSLLLGRGIISTAVELVIFVFVSSTRWYS